MNVVFRLNAGSKYGLGHFQRCLSLAKKFNENNYKVYFLTSGLNNALIRILCKENINHINIYKSKRLEKFKYPKHTQNIDSNLTLFHLKNIKPKYLIKDTYNLEYIWEERILNFKNVKLIVIDDFIKKHNCHLYINFNHFDKLNSKQKSKLGKKILIGPKYAIMPKFSQSYDIYNFIEGTYVLLTLSNDKLYKETYIKVINILLKLNLKIKVVLGTNVRFHKEIKNNFNEYNKQKIQFIQFTNDMERLLANCMYAITGGGNINYEKCCLGVPSLVILLSKDQIALSNYLKKNNSIIIVSNFNDSKLEIKLKMKLKSLNAQKLKKMSRNALKIFSKNSTEKVYDKIISKI